MRMQVLHAHSTTVLAQARPTMFCIRLVIEIGETGSLVVTTVTMGTGTYSPLHNNYVRTRAHRTAEGGERACNVHRRQNAECY